MTVEVVGLLGGKVVDRMMIVLRASSNGKLQFALSQMVINGVTASVPEPASMLLLGSGVGLAITRLRRLRQHK